MNDRYLTTLAPLGRSRAGQSRYIHRRNKARVENARSSSLRANRPTFFTAVAPRLGYLSLVLCEQAFCVAIQADAPNPSYPGLMGNKWRVFISGEINSLPSPGDVRGAHLDRRGTEDFPLNRENNSWAVRKTETANTRRRKSP